MKAEFAEALPVGWERFSRFFFALGDRTRQQILLVFDGSEEICVNDIARLFRLSRPAISHHLKVLREAGLLLSEKRGKEVYYRVHHSYCAEVMHKVHEFIMERAGSRALQATVRATNVNGPRPWDRGTAPMVAEIAGITRSDD